MRVSPDRQAEAQAIWVSVRQLLYQNETLRDILGRQFVRQCRGLTRESDRVSEKRAQSRIADSAPKWFPRNELPPIAEQRRVGGRGSCRKIGTTCANHVATKSHFGA